MSGRMIAGVCTGLARRWGWNVTLVRFLFLLIALIPLLPGLPLYLLLWILIPSESEIHNAP